MTEAGGDRTVVPRGSAAEVFAAFLKLGLTSFGGPIAHLGYFHREIVERRRWIDDSHYGQLVALCQFLPGPASSQLGFALGLIRAGWAGAIAAFIAFTAPSALLLLAFARLLPELERPLGQAAVHGLKLVAVVVVAAGLISMVRRLTPDVARRLMAAGAAAIVVMHGTAAVQLLIVGCGALLGLAFCRSVDMPSGTTFSLRYTGRTGALVLSAFAGLLAIALLPASLLSPGVSVAAAFYRAGALVFGGGHVVLPLLEQAVVAPGWLDKQEFLAGYGAAQAVPGPMFSLAAFLGARLGAPLGGLAWAGVSLAAIFLPGLLLVAGTLPFWRAIASDHRAGSVLAGVNAAVVGLLAAAFYDPVWTSAVLTPADFATALAGFALLAAARAPVLIVLAFCVLSSMARVWLVNGPA